MVMPVSLNSQAQMYSNQNMNAKEKKVNGFMPTVVASLGGIAIQTIPSSIITVPIMKSVDKVSGITSEEMDTVKNTAKQILKNKGLDDKVTIEWLSNKTESNNIIKNSIANGENSLFAPKSKKIDLSSMGQGIIEVEGNHIYVPENSLRGTVFHEIGHADNYNNSTIFKALQKLQIVVSKYAPAAMLLYVLCSRKSKAKEGDGELTKGQKVNNFIRDNAGKITFATALPMLIEEAAATIKGNNFAKAVNPELAKKALKGNALSWFTYLATAVAGSIAVSAAVKIKDSMIEKKEQKRDLEQQKLMAIA